MLETTKMQPFLLDYIKNPTNSETNFKMALEYDGLGQLASAVSYYLRTAERAENDLLKYECLIRAAMCFEKQGSRNFTVKGLLQHAVSILPNRPEAYYHLSRFYEHKQDDGHWNDTYMIASIGEGVADISREGLRTDVGYLGKDSLLFQKALSGWNCGLCDESRTIFRSLMRSEQLPEDYKRIVYNNLKFMSSYVEIPFDTYDRSKYSKLRYKFQGAENIESNHSEAYQDMFVLSITNGKKGGTFIEVGAGRPFYGNNTALLEKTFDWRGISIDLDERQVSNDRKTPFLIQNALEVDYSRIIRELNLGPVVDYLQLDCDPPEVTFEILKKIPFDSFKFRVITYEHDYYNTDKKELREQSRQYLQSKGYILVATDIAPDEWRNYEDWYVHPDHVDRTIVNQMLDLSDRTKKGEDYILAG